MSSTGVQVKNYIVFYFASDLFLYEYITLNISSWDIQEALKMIKQENFAKEPYSFRFFECLEHDPISDGRGGFLEVLRKETKKSGHYFLDVDIVRYEELVKRNDPKDVYLLESMRYYRWPIVVENLKKSSQAWTFLSEDFIISSKTGEILKVGNESKLEEYRKVQIAEWQLEERRKNISNQLLN